MVRDRPGGAAAASFWRQDSAKQQDSAPPQEHTTIREEPAKNNRPAPARPSADAQLAFPLATGGARRPRSDEKPDVREQESHLWQFQNKYIFAGTSDGLWIVDQHAAHERILFEEAMQAFAAERPASQQLLFPVTLELTPEHDAILDEVMPMLEAMGFELQRLSGRSVMVTAYPGSAQKVDDGGMLRRLIEDVAELGFKRTGLKEQIATAYACHAAIRANERLDATTMRWLIERLFGTTMPYVCPHGRPTVVKIEMDELDKRFGRT